MDLDAPELIQALEDFTQQILSPGNQLSSGLEEAITTESNSLATAETAETSDISQNEGSGVTHPMAEPTIQMQTNEEQAEETGTINEDALPLDEPVFQILSEIFEDYTQSNHISASDNIPEDKFNSTKNVKYESLDSFMDSYPYDSWDSPGSVESEILFPELSM